MRFAGVWWTFLSLWERCRKAERVGDFAERFCNDSSPHPIPLLKERGIQVAAAS